MLGAALVGKGATTTPFAPSYAAPETPPAAASASACDPPFYYDGKKKVFKAGCL